MRALASYARMYPRFARSMRSEIDPSVRHRRLVGGDALEVGEQAFDDLGEDLLLRVEVRVEGAVGDPRLRVMSPTLVSR